MATIKVRWNVDELVNVMSLFNVQKVYRAAASSGPWVTEITDSATRVPLVAGTTSYLFDDTSGLSTYWYAVSYYNSSTTLESSLSDPIQGNVSNAPDFLELDDLYAKVGQRRVIELFDDDNDGDLLDLSEVTAYQAILCEAESILYSRLLRSYADKASIVTLAENDAIIRGHCAWIALEIASERRSFAAGREGRGAFVFQYERALAEFDLLSRGRSRSKGEAVAGKSGNVGGVVQPTLVTGESRFTFADEIGPDGTKLSHGGYGLLPPLLLIGLGQHIADFMNMMWC